MAANVVHVGFISISDDDFVSRGIPVMIVCHCGCVTCRLNRFDTLVAAAVAVIPSFAQNLPMADIILRIHYVAVFGYVFYIKIQFVLSGFLFSLEILILLW